MVDLGLVFLCSSGIGVMHRGGNGANSLDLPGRRWRTGELKSLKDDIV